MTRRSRLVARPRLESLDMRCLPAALTPLQLTGAYGLNAINFTAANGSTVKGDGTGQTIAIIAAYHNSYLATELATFDAKYGLPGPTLTVINQAGSRTDAGWAEEEALDVEWAHAAAPGARILVVEAASTTTTAIIAAINTARTTPGVSVVSMSFGSSEFANEASYDSTFTTPAGHAGVTFVASSGDSGAGAEWPASSPNVVAVGGTTLSLGASGNVASETSWSSSGGGVSRYEAEPSYQRKVQNTGRRTTTDVALDANPATGASVYFINPTTGRGVWEQVGGTSLSAPVFAGLIAIADQGRALKGLGSLDGATQTLPALYAAAGTAAYDDISSGTRAGVGYDTVTGLGSPNAGVLVADLVATTTTTPVSTSTVAANITTTTTTAGGSKAGRKAPGKKVGRAEWGYSSTLESPGTTKSWSTPMVLANAGQSIVARSPLVTTFAKKASRIMVAIPTTPVPATPKAADSPSATPAEQAVDDALESLDEEL